METVINGFIISDDKRMLQADRVKEMLSTSYWAKNRSVETINKAIENSICFGAYINGNQVGFARCVTDYSTMYWLCDVIIDSDYRGLGLGKAIMSAITEYDELKPLFGILATSDAQGLYSQFGFSAVDENKYMRRGSAIDITE